MMLTPVDDLKARAEHIVAAVGAESQASIAHGSSQVGGGSLPRTALPSVTVQIRTEAPESLIHRLRAASPPVIGYVSDGVVQLDLRTVFPRQDEHLISAIRTALAP